MDANEKRARELLAAEYERDEFDIVQARQIREGYVTNTTATALRAIMAALAQQAPQPVVDDNGLIVHGDWYTVEHTGTHIFDLDDDRERLLSILLHSNGDVGFAARVEGVGSWQGKATDPVFREALAALGTNPPASQPQHSPRTARESEMDVNALVAELRELIATEYMDIRARKNFTAFADKLEHSEVKQRPAPEDHHA